MFSNSFFFLIFSLSTRLPRPQFFPKPRLPPSRGLRARCFPAWPRKRPTFSITSSRLPSSPRRTFKRFSAWRRELPEVREACWFPLRCKRPNPSTRRWNPCSVRFWTRTNPRNGTLSIVVFALQKRLVYYYSSRQHEEFSRKILSLWYYY